jgi:hypothetical protein
MVKHVMKRTKERTTLPACRHLLTLVLLVGVPVYGVFVEPGDPNRQHQAPEQDQGWQAMAEVENGGAVYLGNGWFLTAGRLGTDATEVRFQGEELSIDPATWTPVLHTLELEADARLFRVQAPERLPQTRISLIDRELNLNDPLLLIGPGRDVGEVVTVDREQRFYQAETSRMKWGRSVVSAFDDAHDGLGYRSRTFDTSLAHGEAQALEGDTGGGVFLVEPGTGGAVLAGLIIHAGLRQDDQGTYAFTSPTVDAQQSSWTRSVDLFHYRDQIMDIVHPEPERPWIWAVAMVGFIAWLLRLARKTRRGSTF